ncbi:MAG: DUF4855 domain-containing protein [Massilibacteroides sp.]|nr:DUF4855 domain-containing protein [Massilibacteroides sp.]
MMVLKKTQVVFWLFTAQFLYASCSLKDKSIRQDEAARQEVTSPEQNISQRGNHPKDMVLIYDGGAHRNIQWNAEHFVPYVSCKDENGTEQWLFDGFLFLEFKDGKGRCFASYYEKQGARKVEWEALVNNYFREGNAMDALEARIEQVITETQKAIPSKRKVVMCLPEPISNQKDWGTLEGDSVDFSIQSDRLAACKWYIDYAEKCFQEASLNNLELTGFYWIAEEATNSRDLAKDVSNYIHEKGYNFYWIPYFRSDGHAEWEKLGFDRAYYQPNYFFKDDIPVSQIEETCQTAIDNGMSLEMEFDERALAKTGWGYRLEDYIRVFGNFGALDSMSIAYYQGGDAFYRLYHSENKEDNKLYHKLANIIAKRKNSN